MFGTLPRLAAPAAAILLAAAPAAAQTAATPPPVPSLAVVGDARVSARPDEARIEFAVITQAPTAREAAAQNAQRTDRVNAALRGKLLSGDLETVGYSLNPAYEYPRDGGQPRLTGYSATNTVRATVRDLTAVGALIDAGVGAGANQVQSLQFLLRDESAVQKRALAQAATRARAKAEALAAALGLRALRVLELREEGAPEIRPLMATMKADQAVATPIEPGSIDVQARVTLVMEIGR